MNQDLRETWGSERWVIDRLVEAVEAGDAEEKLKLARHLLDGYKRHGWRRRRIVEAGMIVLEKDLDPAVTDLRDVLEALQEADVSESRLEEIEQGAALTLQEVAIWREYLVCATFDDERVSMREGNVCVAVEVIRPRRQRVSTLRQWRKISFGTRSDDGERAVERLPTVTRTCQQQQLPVLVYLTAAIAAHRRHQAVASLLRRPHTH